MNVDDMVALAQSYLDSGRPFHAHEVLEALWKTQPAGERDLWQGLAQIAVGFTHAMRGNTGGATTLLRRGAGRVANYTGDTHGVDIAGALTWAETLAAAPTAEPPPLVLHAAKPR
jgi:predicted metal-dependent hydrolase